MMNTSDDNLLSCIKFDHNGLICAIAQDMQSSRVLMVAWMDEAALRQTVKTGFAHYYSRSRQKQWMKGEESGHVQQVHEIRLDCDGDVLLLKIKQVGGIACHTGRESCFYRIWQEGCWVSSDDILKSEAEIYGSRKE